jgi:hypothetical protein
MAADNTITVGLEINGNGEQVTQSVKSIKAELRQATQDAVNLGRKFGEFSPQALEAAQKVANLKDEIGDFKARVDSLNPDAKFTAFSSALQGVAGGFAGVQGAIGLFGTESKELEEQLLRVQSALALSEGLNSVLASRDAFKNLSVLIKTNVITAYKSLSIAIRTNLVTAFTTLRGAIIATGIGALVIGVGLLIANFDKVKQVMLRLVPGLANVGKSIMKIVNSVTDFIGVTSEAERAYERLKKSAEGQNNEIDRQIKLLQAQGGQEEKIAKLQKTKIDNTIKVTKANKDATDEDRKNLKDLENDKKVIDIEENNRKKKEAEDKEKERKEAGKQAAAEAKQARADAKAKADEIKQQVYQSDKELQLARLEGREKEKKQLEFEQAEALKAVEGNAVATQNVKDLYKIKEADLNKKFAEEDKKTAEELEEFKNKLYLDSITNAELRAEKESQLALEKKLKDIEDSKLSAVEKEQAVQDAINAWQFEQDAKDFEAQLKKDAEALAKVEGDFENDRLILEAQRELILSNTTLTAEKRKKILEDNSKAISEIDKKEFESKQANIKKYSDLIGGFSELAGKNTGVGKALAVAEATINTYLAASQVFSAKSPAYIANPFLRFTTAGLAIATGLKNVKSILSVKVPNSGGGGGQGSSNAISGTAPITAPIQQGVSVQQTAVTNGVNINNTDTIKAYVVERDITDSQDRINKIKSAATFGG